MKKCDVRFFEETLREGDTFLLDSPQKSIGLYTRVIELPGASKKFKAVAYKKRSIANGILGNTIQAKKDQEMAKYLSRLAKT